MDIHHKNSKVLKLFVPGRLCLLGEHSDWAGMHRMVNAEVSPGYAIVSGIEQGIYATVEQSDKFIVESTLPAFQDDRFEAEMDRDTLLTVAKQGGFFSYVAGVASYINDNYTVGGLKITVTNMDLPIRSGLSSSAAICVLVARAFNQMYRLKMNTKGEMLVAFRGEQQTPSRCGRLDQACAYGVKPVLMEFDGMEVNSRQLEIGATFYWAIADLNSHKDTVRILSDLNKCFPFATSEKEQRVQEALGADNKEIINRAVTFLQEGDACALGHLMNRAQALFDEKIAPASPEQLCAPVLHSVLADDAIQTWIYGAKGVGSQGDGTVQFLCRDAQSREKLMKYLWDVKGMRSFPLTLKPGQSVRKAIIPVAGFGTRLYPATKGIKKDFMPLIDRDGKIKPALLILLEQLEDAGIEQVCLVIGTEEKEEYEQFFRALPEEHMRKLNDEKRSYEEKIVQLGKKITYVYQQERLGFGHAVFQCKAFTENEPVLLLLGDMVYQSFTEDNCSKQLVQAYEQCGKTVVSIHEVSEDEVMHYGILHGQWDNEEETLLKTDQIYEKPTRDYAREYLQVKNTKGDKQYYAVFGQYVLTPAVFAELENNIRCKQMSHGEYQLTDALDQVREKFGLFGYKPNGKSYDLGLPETYRETMWEFGRHMDYQKLSVVMPAYNEGDNIYNNLKAASACLQRFCANYELIAVNDGSKDMTKEEIRRAAAEDDHIKAVSYEKNRGKGGAIQEGVHAASGTLIAFLDADLDISPSHLEQYIQELESQSADIVIGSKMHRDSQLEYPVSRRFVSFCYYLILKTLFHLRVKDTQTGIKLFRADVIKNIIGMVRTSGYAYDIEILAVAARFGYKIVEQPVTLKFTRGEAFGRIRLKDILRMAKDTLSIFYWLKIKKLYDAGMAPKEEY